jgi:hypothetical protein
MTPKPQLAADGESHRTAADRSAAAVTGDTFVINLCSSTTPMALVHPDAPELKRFRFFVSRRLEDGRERFRLHMGHFETLEEAEDWLSVVRDIYPGAWAGEAPGKRLRSGTAAATQSRPSAAAPPSNGAAFDEHVANITPPTSAVPSASPPPLAVAGSAPVASALVEVPSPPLAIAEPAAVTSALVEPPSAPPLAPPRKTVAAAPMAPKQPPPTPVVAQPRKSAAAPRPARPAAKMPLSNVREVLAALDERDTNPNVAATAAPRSDADASQAQQSLTDTQVMQILEARRTEESPRVAATDVSGGIPMLRPDDTGTRRALKAAVQDNSAVSFAVQLQWSVDAMALEKVPPLAIFSAYTLYTVEGNRDGRKWYGLRLGFFSDANAARQVAQYVRSDFTSVAVVPVSSQERTRAATAHKTPAPSFSESHPATESDEIKLLDADRAPAERTVAAPASSARTGSAAARAAAVRSKALRSKEPSAQRKGPYSLEETLEILGAGSLEIDNGRGELVNDTGVRHMKIEVRKNSPFQRLITRLTERVRKS